KIFFVDPPQMFWYAGGILDLRRGVFVHRGHGEIDHGQFDAEERTGWATGCALFAPRRVFEDVGLLDESLGLYNEDVDYCLRAAQRGFPMVYVPRARVWHKVSASVGGGLSPRKLRWKWISLRRLLRRHLPSKAERGRALIRFLLAESPALLCHSVAVRSRKRSGFRNTGDTK
ncbi:MAG: glycosyltransferase, partial [bacterium]|nr:glycosyltransferase [bacterium]